MTGTVLVSLWYTHCNNHVTIQNRTQEIAFLNQAYAEVEAVNFELEQYKQQNKELQNQLAQAAEEQETLATQLYETGHHLDEASAEVKSQATIYTVMIMCLVS